MKVSAYFAVTLDDKIATVDGNVDFLSQWPEPSGGYLSFDQYLHQTDCMILGRKTFDKIVSFGRKVFDENYGNNLQSILVWSHRPDLVEIPDYMIATTQAMSGSPKELLRQLSNQKYQHVYIDGGTVVQQFLQANLLDELHVTRVPMVLGRGLSLFGNASVAKSVTLQHVQTHVYENGMVMTSYNINKNEQQQLQ
jgi:dihydrofolate reductase